MIKHLLLVLCALVAAEASGQDIITGAEQTDTYLSLLQGKRVAVLVNQTSLIGTKHLVDSLSERGVLIVKIFAPEHGFRGTAGAGEHIKNGYDTQTSLPIVSLYGNKHAPDSNDLKTIDVLLYDIQDVGCRFYTFISTLHYAMESCVQNHIPLVVLDRPNPNGYTIDGPVLKKEFQSFVGVDPIPVMHGLTVGEYAKMVQGEKWINDADSLNMTVVPCKYYTHSMLYPLPEKPSPNLPNAKAVDLYPSLCFFEGTNVSVGRGTDFPFQVIGSPTTDASKTTFSFTPEPKEGALDPFLKGKTCNGFDLREQPVYGIDLSFLLKMYQLSTDKVKFFLANNFFDKLAGNDELRTQIQMNISADEIKKSWQHDLEEYKELRKKYLLYP